MNEWVQLGSAAVMALGAYLVAVRQIRANQADASQKVQEASVGLWAPYKAELEQTREYLKSVELELVASRTERLQLAARVAKLEAWIVQNTSTDPASINGTH